MSRKNSKLETKSFLQKERILPNIFHWMKKKKKKGRKKIKLRW